MSFHVTSIRQVRTEGFGMRQDQCKMRVDCMVDSCCCMSYNFGVIVAFDAEGFVWLIQHFVVEDCSPAAVVKEEEAVVEDSNV